MGTAPKANKDSLVLLCEKKQTSFSVGKLSGFVDVMRSRKNGRVKSEKQKKCRNRDYKRAIWKQEADETTFSPLSKCWKRFYYELESHEKRNAGIFLHNSFMFLCSLLLVVRIIIHFLQNLIFQSLCSTY